MKEQIQKIILALFPELSGNYHLAKRAKVLRINDLPNQKETTSAFRPRYACDVVVLDEAGKNTKQELFDVLIPMTGLYSLPQPDDIVRLQYDYGNPNMPVITGILTQGQTLPKINQEEILLYQNESNQIRIQPNQTIINAQTFEELAQNKKQTAVQMDQKFQKVSKAVGGDDVEEISGTKQITAGAVGITSTAGVNIGAITNAQLASGTEFSVLAGKKLGIGSVEIEVNTPLSTIKIFQSGNIEISTKTGAINIQNNIGSIKIDQLGKLEMKNTASLKEIIQDILDALSVAIITVGTTINQAKIKTAQTKLDLLFK